MYAVRSGRLGAYLRGGGAGLHGLARMRRKHRALVANRGITDGEFLGQLRQSERQIYDWQQSLPPAERSGLLKLYFGLFGKP